VGLTMFRLEMGLTILRWLAVAAMAVVAYFLAG
jgi:hypothetical protein